MSSDRADPAASDGRGPPKTTPNGSAVGKTGLGKTKLIPGRRLIPFAAGALPLALFDGGSGLGLLAAAAYDGLVLSLAALEGRALSRAIPTVERRMDSRLLVGVENTVHLRLRNRSARALTVTVRDGVPNDFSAEPEEIVVELPPHARREVSYRVVPSRRGRFRFGDLHLRVESRVGLAAMIATLPAEQDARVYPNVLGPRRYDLAARLGDLASVGIRSVRKGGGGGQFEQLREYVSGDAFRDLDWKSTAKRQRPITRVFEQERSQIVLVAIDAGRMMATQLGRISKLDHAINAALLLFWVALKNGDRAGLIVFSDRVVTYVPPARGPGQYRRLLDALYGIEAEDAYVDFRRLTEFIQIRARKRALLVIFSDLLDESHAMPLADHAAILGRRHLPVCVTMIDEVAVRIADAPVANEDDAYRRAAAADLLEEREMVKAHLEKGGVTLVEAAPGELAVATVNRYLQIKARHRL